MPPGCPGCGGGGGGGTARGCVSAGRMPTAPGPDGTPVSVRLAPNRSSSFGGLARSVGTLSAYAGTGRTSLGVTVMTSSVSSRWKLVDLNSRPMIGIDHSTGNCRTVSWKSVLSRPASAKLSPSCSSTTVLALRVCRPGMRRLFTTIEADVDSTVRQQSGTLGSTDGLTWRLPSSCRLS